MTLRDSILFRIQQRLSNAPQPSRRQVLRLASLAALAAFTAPLSRAQSPAARIRFSADPFSLGVASGYPQPDAVSLWTRLAPEPLAPQGGMQPENVNVAWEVAEDERFSRIAAQGMVRAVPELGHSVHAQATGLRPDRRYFYRFLSGQAVSPVGRTRTAPAVDAEVARLRFAIGSCQHYEQGYFSAHRHAQAEDLDLMMFMGDYIYENSWGDDLVRRHAGDLLHTLSDYRRRHAQYRTDPDLQALHGTVPWVLTWDDHEVDNDYAGDRSEHLDPNFLARRAIAYQAYFEHMPLPPAMWPRGSALKLYTTLDWGRLARIYTLDNRQYRDPQACPEPMKRGGSTEVALKECPELADRQRTLLGREQETWLAQRFASSNARWNLLAQQTLVSPLGGLRPRDDGQATAWTDGWDGYPAARQRLIEAMRQHELKNPVILGGDLHATVVGNLHLDPGNGRTPVIASEFCGTSVSAQGLEQALYDTRKDASPHIDFANSSRRGYLVFDLRDTGLDVRLRALATVKEPVTAVETAARWRVEADRPGVQRA